MITLKRFIASDVIQPSDILVGGKINIKNIKQDRIGGEKKLVSSLFHRGELTVFLLTKFYKYSLTVVPGSNAMIH